MAIFHLNPHSGSIVSSWITEISDEDVILAESTRRLDDFRAYLNNHASEFMDKEEFGAYFNIPFILSVEGDRQEEFKDFFEVSWAEDVKSTLESALEEMTQEGDEPDTIAEGAGTQLEKMLKFYVRHNAAGSKTEPNNKWEEIEMRAEEAAAGIEKQKSTNKRKTFELNQLAVKYEGLKIEYECYLEQLEDKLKTEIYHLPGVLILESNFRKAAMDERDKHEADALKSLQKDLGRKLNIQEIRIFKTQYKEKFMNYKMLNFTGAKNSAQVDNIKQTWKRIIFEYSHHAYKLVVEVAGGEGTPFTGEEPEKSLNKKDGVKDVSKKEGPTKKKTEKPVSKEDIEKREKKLDSMQKDFSQLESLLNLNPDALTRLVKELNIESIVDFDKQYKLEGDYIASCIEVTEEDIKKMDAEKQAALAAKDGSKAKPDGQGEPEKPKEADKDGSKQLEKKATVSELKEPPKYTEDIRERTRISLAVLNQKFAYKEKIEISQETLFLEQILINVENMVASLCKDVGEATKTLMQELELSLAFLLYSTKEKEQVKVRLRKHEYIVARCKQMYKYMSSNTKLLAEKKKLKAYTLTLLKLSRLVLEAYSSGPQQLFKILPSFVQMHMSQDDLEISPELMPEVRAVLVSCVAVASKRSGDLQEEEREELTSFLIKKCSMPVPEMPSELIAIELEASLICIAAMGVQEKLSSYQKIEEFTANIEKTPILKNANVTP